MINQICNLRCPYCFANDYVKQGSKGNINDMTMENFKLAVEFALAGTDRIGIIGGEPTLHPEFRVFLELLINDDRAKSIVIFTNGIRLDLNMGVLLNSKVSLLVNVNNPGNVGSSGYSKIVKNLDKLHFTYYKGDAITLGINMYEPDFKYEFILDLLKRYKKAKVRTSVTVPNNVSSREQNPLDYFRKMKPRVMEFFKCCAEIGVMPTYDCNAMPLCIYSYEDLYWIENNLFPMEKKSGGFCNVKEGANCSPVIDILPDLSTARCFGVKPSNNVYITNFSKLDDLAKYYTSIYDDIGYNIPISDPCIHCKERLRKACMGGCLGFKLKEIEEAREVLAGCYLSREGA